MVSPSKATKASLLHAIIASIGVVIVSNAITMSGVTWNVFHYLADVSHTLSKCILIFAIHNNKSAEGVSLITQILYLVVFCARYLFLPWKLKNAFKTTWNVTLKLFYIGSSAYIVFLMMRVYARTREREKAWKLGAFSFFPSLLLSPFVMLIFDKKASWSFSEFMWMFSIILESTCILPQLLLLRQTSVPTVLDSFYLIALGSYRAFYLLSWFIRAVQRQPVDPVSVIFGLIQTALYIDFAWVYYTRQRIKLRGGTVVDGEDLRRGWLVKRLIGSRAEQGDDDDDDVEGAGQNSSGEQHRKTNWGSRGISVSADDGEDEIQTHANRAGSDPEREPLADPTAFEDDEDDEPSKASQTISPH